MIFSNTLELMRMKHNLSNKFFKFSVEKYETSTSMPVFIIQIFDNRYIFDYYDLDYSYRNCLKEIEQSIRLLKCLSKKKEFKKNKQVNEILSIKLDEMFKLVLNSDIDRIFTQLNKEFNPSRESTTKELNMKLDLFMYGDDVDDLSESQIKTELRDISEQIQDLVKNTIDEVKRTFLNKDQTIKSFKHESENYNVDDNSESTKLNEVNTTSKYKSHSRLNITL